MGRPRAAAVRHGDIPPPTASASFVVNSRSRREPKLISWSTKIAGDYLLRELDSRRAVLPVLTAIAAARHRVVVIDGPGQGSVLEGAGLVLAHEWSGRCRGARPL